jgi:lysozyme
MKTSSKGLHMIKNEEGWRDKVYLDAVGKATIGYGHLIKKGENFSKPITKDEGEKILINDLKIAENAVKSLVKVKLNQNQFDALVSFIFNVGSGALIGTTSLKVLNSGNYKSFADRLLLWDKGVINGKLTPILGLTRRRQRERALFLGLH